jgi:flagellar basal-body rod protein FlgB
MIDALFNQPGFLAANKALDAVVLRGQAIENNLANLETPGYKRVDLAPDFESALNQAIASGNPGQIAALQPTLAVDPNAVVGSLDGNTVHLENELMQLNENGVAHSLETQLVTGMFQKMQMAITGKNA